MHIEKIRHVFWNGWSKRKQVLNWKQHFWEMKMLYNAKELIWIKSWHTFNQAYLKVIHKLQPLTCPDFRPRTRFDWLNYVLWILQIKYYSIRFKIYIHFGEITITKKSNKFYYFWWNYVCVFYNTFNHLLFHSIYSSKLINIMNRRDYCIFTSFNGFLLAFPYNNPQCFRLSWKSHHIKKSEPS